MGKNLLLRFSYLPTLSFKLLFYLVSLTILNYYTIVIYLTETSVRIPVFLLTLK